MAQKFLVKNFGNQHLLKHLFVNNEDILDTHAKCLFCNSRTHATPTGQADVLSIGLDCQPYSNARFKKGKTARTGPPETHPGFATTQQFINMLKTGRYAGFILEQIRQFQDYIMPETGLSYLESFIAQCKDLGFACTAQQLDHGRWCESPKKRIFVIGCSATLGHTQAVKWIASIIASVDQQRGSASQPPPTPVFGTTQAGTGLTHIICVTAPQEAARRARSQAQNSTRICTLFPPPLVHNLM